MKRRTALGLLAMNSAGMTLIAGEEHKKLGIALVGLGSYSKGQLGPALKETKNCYLAGIVTGSPEKIPYWQKEYNIPEENIYSYETFDQIADNKDIDVIYIVLPDGMHHEWVIKAANLGKHVICEKPMAKTLQECQEMMEACEKNGVTLQIGYRLYWDPYHRAIMKSAMKGELANMKSFDGSLAYYVKHIDAAHWAISDKLSVYGALGNMGVYPVQAAFYGLQDSPVKVHAKEINTRPNLFKETPEGHEWLLTYADGKTAKGQSSRGVTQNFLIIEAEGKGCSLDPCYSYSGLEGELLGKKLQFPTVNQQALQMDGQVESILRKTASLTPGEMGARDVQVMEAIVESAKTGKEVEIRSLVCPPLPQSVIDSLKS